MFNPLNEIKGIVELNKASVIHFVHTVVRIYNVIMAKNVVLFDVTSH